MWQKFLIRDFCHIILPYPIPSNPIPYLIHLYQPPKTPSALCLQYQPVYAHVCCARIWGQDHPRTGTRKDADCPLNLITQCAPSACMISSLFRPVLSHPIRSHSLYTCLCSSLWRCTALSCGEGSSGTKADAALSVASSPGALSMAWREASAGNGCGNKGNGIDKAREQA